MSMKTPEKVIKKAPKKGHSQEPRNLEHVVFCDMGVSKNRDTAKWMVYNGKPY